MVEHYDLSLSGPESKLFRPQFNNIDHVITDKKALNNFFINRTDLKLLNHPVV